MSYTRRATQVAWRYLRLAQRRRNSEVMDALLYPTATIDRGLSKRLGGDVTNGGEPLSVTVIRQPETPTLAKWDELVRKVPCSDVAQLSAWADVRRAAGFEPLYMFVRRAAELVGGALVMRRRLPIVGWVGYVPYGPVVSPDADREPVVAALATVLRRLARRNLRILFVQPPLGGEDISLQLIRHGFRTSQAGIAPVASLRLDLTEGEDELWARLPKALRKRSRRWPEQGVRVRIGTQDDVAHLARLHAASAEYQGFDPIPLDYLANLYRRLAPAGHAVLFIGEVEGRPVVADLLTSCGGVLKGRLGGMDRDSATRQLRVSSAVRWEEIRWARANGYRWFDFGGIRDTAVSILEDERSDHSMLTSSESFKASFGGTPFRYPTPAEILSPRMVRVAYDLTRRWPVGRRIVEWASRRLRARPRIRR